MFYLSNSSKEKYDTLHKDLRLIIDEALKYSTIDFGLSEGHRPPEKQFEYFKKGRKEVGGEWVIVDKSKVVTYKDGYNKKGKHNYNPSLAVDVVPYPIDWKDIKRFIEFANYVKGVADMLFAYGAIDNRIEWGGNWKSFKDYPHFQIK